MDYIKRTSIKLKHQVTKNPFDRLVSEATNEDSQFPSNETLMSIADQSQSYTEYSSLMKHIWKRISPDEKNWIKILKTLNLIEFLLYFGNPRCLVDFKEEKKRLRYTSQFELMGKGVNRGLIVREKSNYVLELLENNEKLEKSKTEMQNMKNKILYRNDSLGSEDAKKKGLIENIKDKISLEKVTANIKGVGNYVENIWSNIVSKEKKKEGGLHLDEFQDIGTYDDYFAQKKQDNANYSGKSVERTYEIDREIESLGIHDRDNYEINNDRKKPVDFKQPEKENLFPKEFVTDIPSKPVQTTNLLDYGVDKKMVLSEKQSQPDLI